MTLLVIVVSCGVGAALVTFAWSVSRRMDVVPVDTARPERAVRRSILRHPKLLRFLRQRMDRRTAGGFLLTASFVVLFVVSIAVGVLLDLIDNNNALARADRWAAAWGSRHGTLATVEVLRWITQLGGSAVVITALAATAAYDYVQRRSREVFLFVLAVGGGELVLANVLKLIVRRDRPAVLHLVGAHGFSFPSGHTVSAAAAWTAIALVVGRGRRRRVRAAWGALAVLIAISVAASRALLGVHWLSDVLAGLAIGWGWFALVAIFFGGRAQRLGDPITAQPQGTATDFSSTPPTARVRRSAASGATPRRRGASPSS
jgi:undecaprenyl-diphosphatase